MSVDHRDEAEQWLGAAEGDRFGGSAEANVFAISAALIALTHATLAAIDAPRIVIDAEDTPIGFMPIPVHDEPADGGE